MTRRIDFSPPQRATIEAMLAKWMRFDVPPDDPIAFPVEGPCWTWTRGTFVEGYGCVSIGRKTYRTHRLMAYLGGMQIDGMVIDHLCRNVRCMNPMHLDPTTDKVNARRGVRARHARAGGVCGHCGSENGYVKRSGEWACRPCRMVKWHARRKADPSIRDRDNATRHKREAAQRSAQ